MVEKEINTNIHRDSSLLCQFHTLIKVNRSRLFLVVEKGVGKHKQLVFLLMKLTKRVEAMA